MSPTDSRPEPRPEVEPTATAREIAYVMTFNINNDTPSKLEPMGVSFYKEDGDVHERPQSIHAHSSGSGGVLMKFAGNGLFGLVGYSTPDPSKTLVINTWMPTGRGTKNRCWIGLVSSGTTISAALADSFHAYTPTGFTETKLSWEFTHKKEHYLLIIEPRIGDDTAFNTYTTINISFYKKAETSPV